MEEKLILEEINDSLDNFAYDVLKEEVSGKKKYFIRGAFSKADVINKNKRVYPLKTLKESVDSCQPTIKEKKMVGELEHPSCLVGRQYSVLTKGGWKDFDDIKVGEEALSLNDDGIFEYKKILEIIDQPYTGKVYHVKGRNIDSTFTPNHRFYLKGRYGKNKVATIEEIYNNRTAFVEDKTPAFENKEEEVCFDKLLSITEEDYSGQITCLSVEDNHNFYMKQNGKAFLTGNSVKINLDRIAVKINQLSVANDGTMIGEMEILDTPCGKTLQTLVDSGIGLGVSTRGVGTVKKVRRQVQEGVFEDVSEVQPDYRLRAIDIVFDPSAGEYGNPNFVTEGLAFDNGVEKETKKLSEVWTFLFS